MMGGSLSSVGSLIVVQWKLARHHVADTFAGLMSLTVYTLISIVVFYKLFEQPETVSPEDFPAILLLAGILRIAWGLVDALTENLWAAGRMAKTGELLYYIVSPMPTLLHIIASRILFERFVDLVWGIGLITVALSFDHAPDLTVGKLFGLSILLVVSTVTFFAVILFGAAASVHWLGESAALMSAAAQGAELGLFPAQVYSAFIKEAFLLIVPVFTGSFVIGSLFFNLSPAEAGTWLWLAVPALLFAGSSWFWSYAIDRYEGTGS